MDPTLDPTQPSPVVPLTGLGALSAAPAVGPSSLPPPNGAYMANTGLANLNAYNANRYSDANAQAISSNLDAANQGLASFLSNPAVDDRSKWFKAAAAFGRPTGNGSFTTAVSNGLDAMTTQESADFQRKQQYTYALEQMLQQRAQQQYDAFQQGQQQSVEKAAQFGMLAMKPGNGVTPIVKVVNGQLVKFDPATQETTVLAGGQSAMYQKFYNQYLDLGKSIYTDPTDLANYAASQASQAMSQAGAFTVTPPAAAGANTEIARLTQIQSDAVARGDYATANQMSQRISALKAGSDITSAGPTLPVVPPATAGSSSLAPSPMAAPPRSADTQGAMNAINLNSLFAQYNNATDPDMKASFAAAIAKNGGDVNAGPPPMPDNATSLMPGPSQPAAPAAPPPDLSGLLAGADPNYNDANATPVPNASAMPVSATVPSSASTQPAMSAPALPTTLPSPVGMPQIKQKVSVLKDAAGNPIGTVPEMVAPGQGAQVTPFVGANGQSFDTSQLTPQQMALVDKIGTYDMAPPAGPALRSGPMQAIMAAVAQKYPDYDATQYAAKSKALKDFSTGPQGNSLRSFAVATNHLDTLGQLTDALQNGDFPLVNKIANLVSTQVGGTAPTNFDTAKDIVSKEVVKAIVGAGGGVSEREELAKRMSNASTPAQLKEQIEYYKTLMGAQRDALTAQYANTTGRTDAATRFNFGAPTGTAPGIDQTALQTAYAKYGIK